MARSKRLLWLMKVLNIIRHGMHRLYLVDIGKGGRRMCLNKGLDSLSYTNSSHSMYTNLCKLRKKQAAI